jgi:hypothetical protein
LLRLLLAIFGVPDFHKDIAIAISRMSLLALSPGLGISRRLASTSGQIVQFKRSPTKWLGLRPWASASEKIAQSSSDFLPLVVVHDEQVDNHAGNAQEDHRSNTAKNDGRSGHRIGWNVRGSGGLACRSGRHRRA